MTSQATGSRGLGRHSLVMAAGTAVSRVGGVVRNMMMVAIIGGTGLVANAFDMANKLPNIFFAVLAGGMLNAVLVPQIVRAFRAKNSQERLDKLLTVAGVLILGLTVVLTAAASVVILLITDNAWTPEQRALATVFAYWCIPQLFFYGLYTLLGQVLNAREQFGPFMWAPVANNIISIIGFGIFWIVFGSAPERGLNDLEAWDTPRTILLAATATLGIVGQALVLLVPLARSGFTWRFRWGFRGIGLRSAGAVAGWTFAAVVLEQLGVLYLSLVASATVTPDQIDAGVYTGPLAYSQALLIYLLPHSLVTVSIATALFTGLSKAAADGDTDGVRSDLSLGVRTVGVFTIFATAAFAVLAAPLTALIVPTAGRLGTQSIAPVLVALSLGLVALGAMVLMKWVYFAYEDGKSVFWITVPSTASLVIGLIATQIWLPKEYWVIAAGASFALGNWVTCILRTGGLRRILGGRMDGGRILGLHVRATVAAVVSAALGWGLYQLLGGFDAIDFDHGVFGTLFSGLWISALCGTLMLVSYVLVLRLLRVQELDTLLIPIRRRLGR